MVRMTAQKSENLPMEKCYSNFIRSIRTQATKDLYDFCLGKFKGYMKAKTYAELLKYEVPELQDKIVDYVDFLKEKKAASSSIRTMLAGIRHFYVMNDMVLNWAKIAKFVGESRKTVHDRIPTREEIQRVLDVSDVREKAMVFLLLAGLRIGALPGLKMKDLKKWENEGLYQLTIYAGEKEQYTTFMTPEGSNALDSYFEYRKRYGEKLAADAPVIREHFNVENGSAKTPRPLTIFAIKTALERVLVNSGIRKRGKDASKRKELTRFHSFRKFFNTMLNQAGVKPIIKEVLMGHKAGLEASYLRASDKELLGEFLKALGELTISDAEEWKAKASQLQLTLDEKLKDMQAQLDAVNQWKKDKEALEQQPQILQEKKRKKA